MPRGGHSRSGRRRRRTTTTTAAEVSAPKPPAPAGRTLHHYEITCAVLDRLECELKSARRRDQRTLRRELRQWLGLARLFESDLCLNPASQQRSPDFVPWEPAGLRDDGDDA